MDGVSGGFVAPAVSLPERVGSAMRFIIRTGTLACAGAVYTVLGCASALAGGQVGLAVGPPVPVLIPPPSYIPAPLPLQPQANGAGVAPVQPLPPLLLYTTPTVVVPVVPHDGRRRR